MNFYWANWSDFAAMGGYGAYVWGSFGMAALAVAIELAQIAARRRALLRNDDET
jgi:heme exporter protein D